MGTSWRYSAISAFLEIELLYFNLLSIVLKPKIPKGISNWILKEDFKFLNFFFHFFYFKGRSSFAKFIQFAILNILVTYIIFFLQGLLRLCI